MNEVGDIMPKRIKMTRKKRQKQFKNIDEWLIHKANLRRKNEEEGRKRAAGKIDRGFKADTIFWGLV
jgi:hypothetical protein